MPRTLPLSSRGTCGPQHVLACSDSALGSVFWEFSGSFKGIYKGSFKGIYKGSFKGIYKGIRVRLTGFRVWTATVDDISLALP